MHWQMAKKVGEHVDNKYNASSIVRAKDRKRVTGVLVWAQDSKWAKSGSKQRPNRLHLGRVPEERDPLR